MALGAAAVGVIAVLVFVDLSPRVQGDFFFAYDDPQMQAVREVADAFPGGAQLILRVTVPSEDVAGHRKEIDELTDDLLAVDGVEGGFSITTADPENSPLFQRILRTPDPGATNIVLQVDGTDPELLLPRIEAVVDTHESDQLSIVISGVPAIVEMVRRSLYRDLIVFSSAAIVVFALLIGIIYREVAIVVGTIATCLVSVSATLLIVQALGMGIGLLTANLVTIVFVLTLSHVVFLTANWRAALGTDRPTLIRGALSKTLEGSFWSMTTTLLGFASLLIATAQPLRELGMAGMVGTLTAFTTAYVVYPSVLGKWARVQASPGSNFRIPSLRRGKGTLWFAVLLFGSLSFGLPQLDTDPSLLAYFAPGSELREGLALVDADGGSSTLDIVVSVPGGGTVTSPEAYPRLDALQAEFEADSAVGVVLSPTLIVDHARTIPLAGLFPVETLLDLASSDELGSIALGFVTPDRARVRYSLRMRERVEEPREEVMARLTEKVEEAGLHTETIAGLYDLQAKLARLIASSLRIGIGGLLMLFLGIALIVARSGFTAVAMWVCLGVVPLATLGTFGHARIAIDIITSPAANIALAIGADSMIHLVIRVRRLAARGVSSPWEDGVEQIGRPVMSASTIICVGFGIFILSSFPPTQRFGLAVIVGTIVAATVALVVLPRLDTVIKDT